MTYSPEQRRARYLRRLAGAQMSTGRPMAACPSWDEDAIARELVARNPDGLGLDQIGEHLGLSRERVRQVEARALEQLRHALEAEGLDADEVGAWLSRARVESDPDTTAPRTEAWASSCEVRDRPLPVEPWSEHGQRVEAACCELDAIRERAQARRQIDRVIAGMEL